MITPRIEKERDVVDKMSYLYIKKRKGIPLKVNSSKEDYKDSSNSEEKAENFNLMVKKFGKFLKSKDKKFSKSSMKIENNNNNNFTCFKCGN